MPRTRTETAEFVIASLKTLGIKPHPESRLMRMLRVLRAATETIRPDHPDFETALEADRDMQLLEYVFEQDHAKSGHAGFACLLHKLTDDSVLPQDDREQSNGRNTQFELFVAAICQAAGFIPVDYREPDITCAVQGGHIGIAAKRIKSENQVKKRIPEAAKQIQRSGQSGVIALDTSVGLNPNNERITTVIPDEEFGSLYQEALIRFLRRYDERIREWVRGRGVLGIVVHDHQLRIQTDGNWSLSSMNMRFCTAEDEAGRQLFKLFEFPYVNALPNTHHL
jgi:hypothetical protein